MFTQLVIPEDEYGNAAIHHVYKHNSNVCLVVSRKHNGNLVVLEAILNKQREIVNIDTFWLDVDPAYRKPRRAKHIVHDRVELTSFDKIAYDLKILQKDPQCWQFKFKKCKKVLLACVTKNGVSCFMKKQGELYKIHHLHIQDRTILGMLPTVDYVQIVSYHVKTKEKHVDRIVE